MGTGESLNMFIPIGSALSALNIQQESPEAWPTPFEGASFMELPYFPYFRLHSQGGVWGGVSAVI